MHDQVGTVHVLVLQLNIFIETARYKFKFNNLNFKFIQCLHTSNRIPVIGHLRNLQVNRHQWTVFWVRGGGDFTQIMCILIQGFEPGTAKINACLFCI